MDEKLTNTQIENILILNEELLEIKRSEGRHYRYHKNENEIYQTLKSCFFNEDFNALDLFKSRGLFFDVRSTFGQASLLYDSASYLGANKKAEDNHYKNMKLLLNYDFNPNFIHTNDISCLMVSIHSKERFRLLLDHGADPLLMPDTKFTDVVDFIDNMLKNITNKDVDFKYDQSKFEKNIDNLVDNRDYAKAFMQKQKLNNNNSLGSHVKRKSKLL